MNEIDQILTSIFSHQTLILATLSSPHQAKVVIRPIQSKGQTKYQVTQRVEEQAMHRNETAEECLNWLKENIGHFKQSFFYTHEADYHLLIGKKGNRTLLKKTPSKNPVEAAGHNRQKNYIWKEGLPLPFLVHLGVMNAEGKVYAAKQDKFRQINRFIEMVDDILPHLERTKLLRIVDFGCGKAYLTFALYHFLKITKGYQIQMVGLDLKEEVIKQCQKLARTLGYEKELTFLKEDINTFQCSGNIDLMISLHACDTATDAALEKAVRWNAKVILAAPCCQHELMSQVKQETLNPILRHGILKERLAAIATDAARVQLLDVLGYQTQILEFIDSEHTPKNLLIRAVRQEKPFPKAAWESYLKFKQALNIFPSLEKRFQNELPICPEKMI